jgi:hypothetical protein
MDEHKPKSQSFAPSSSTALSKEARKFSENIEFENAQAEEGLDSYHKRNENKKIEKKDFRAQLASFLKEDFSPPPSLQGTISKDRVPSQGMEAPQPKVNEGKISNRQDEFERNRTKETESFHDSSSQRHNKNKNIDLPLKKNDVKRLYEDYGDLKVLNDENSDDQIEDNLPRGPNVKKEMGLGATWKRDALVQKINKENLLEYLNDLEIKMPNDQDMFDSERGNNREQEELLIE